MKRTGLSLMIGVVAGLTVLSVGAVAPVPPQKPSEVEQLKKEVAALRRRVDLLEKRLNDKEGVILVAPQDGRVRPDIIDPYAIRRETPRNWKQGEFNGMTYYIVPINNAHKPTGAVEKQTPQNETPAGSKAPDKP